MPFVPVPAAALAELVFSTPGGRAINTLWFTNDGGWEATSLGNLAGVLEDWWTTNIRPMVASAVHLTSIRCTSQVTATSPAIENAITPPKAGSDGNPMLPSNVTGAVTFLTEFRGRSNRGRNYVIGLTEGDVSNDTITDAVVNAYVSGYNDLIADAVAEGFVWVVASRYSGVDFEGNPIPRVSGQTTPVTSTKMDNTVDSQRRRLLHRGQ